MDPKTEVEIHEKGFYEKVEVILESCVSIKEKIIEQEEAKIGYIACTDPETEKELIRDINGLNKGRINRRHQFGFAGMHGLFGLHEIQCEGFAEN